MTYNIIHGLTVGSFLNTTCDIAFPCGDADVPAEYNPTPYM